MLDQMWRELAAEDDAKAAAAKEFLAFSNALCRTLAELRLAGATRAQIRALLLHFIERLGSRGIT